MAMIPATMDDVLSLTQRFHQQLSDRLSAGARQNARERERLLLEYLAEHENKLARTMETFRERTDLGPLNTWFYEYTDRHKIGQFDPAKLDFKADDCERIASELAELHDQLIDLYTHLYQRAESQSAKQTLEQLLAIERDKTKLMSFESSRASEL